MKNFCLTTMRYLCLTTIAFVPCAFISIMRGQNSFFDFSLIFGCIFLGLCAFDIVEFLINCSPKKSKEFLNFLNFHLMNAFFYGTVIWYLTNHVIKMEMDISMEYWLSVLSVFVFSCLVEKLTSLDAKS